MLSYHTPSGPGRLPSTGFVLVPAGDWVSRLGEQAAGWEGSMVTARRAWKSLAFPHLRHSFESNSPMAVHSQRKATTSALPASCNDARINQRYLGNGDTGLELPKALLLMASLKGT